MLGTAATPLSSPSLRDPDRGEAERYALAARLMDSLLHDARNPLNALSINIEVLAEKVRLQSGGTLPPSQEKNFRAMRDQIRRIDGILRLFAPHVAQVGHARTSVDLSELVAQAAEVLAHEARRARVRLLLDVAPGLAVCTEDLPALRFLVTRTILLGIEGSAVGGEVSVLLEHAQGRAVLRVGGGAPSQSEALGAVQAFAERLGGMWSAKPRELSVSLPLL